MRLISLLLVLITVLGCKKDEPTSWDTELAAPIAFGRLDLNDLFADSLLAENPDGSLSLQYNQKVLELVIDSLIEIPGDTVENVWSLPVSLNVPPNTLIFSQEDEFEFTNGSASLSSARLRNGELTILITNEIASEIVLEYEIPEAISDGESFSVDVIVPPSADGVPGTAEIEFDIAGYSLDLTGEDGNAYNTLKTVTRIRSPADAANTQIIANQEVSLLAIYQSLSISEAVGYFNTAQTDFDGVESTFDEFTGLYEAILSLESATAQLKLTNGFGADLRAVLGDLTISNSFTEAAAQLENSSIEAPINLTRALRVGNTLIPSQQSILLNPQNSNITSFIEVLGDSLSFSGSATLNPLGNISNFNDFILAESSLDIEFELDIPLNFSITNLLLRDTIALSLDSDGIFPLEMDLYMLFENAFPISMEITPSIIDQSGNVVLLLNDYLADDSAVISGSIDPAMGPSVTVLKYSLDAAAVEIVRNANSIVIAAAAETSGYPDHISIIAEQGIDIKISSTAKIRVQ